MFFKSNQILSFASVRVKVLRNDLILKNYVQKPILKLQTTKKMLFVVLSLPLVTIIGYLIKTLLCLIH